MKTLKAIGFDDGCFSKKDEKVLIVGVVTNSKGMVEGVLSSAITRDGNDATRVIAKLVNSSKHYSKLKVVFLQGTTFAGFNIVDLRKLHEKTGKPVISVLRKKPKYEKVMKALARFPSKKKKFEQQEEFNKFEGVYFKAIGINNTEAISLIKSFRISSVIPEPIRLAHLIASGITRGESSGRA